LENKTDRRNMLKLIAAGAIGAIASAIKIPKAKAEGETVVVGGEYTTATTRTMIQGDVGNAGVIEGRYTGSGNGYGVYCNSTYIAVRGYSASGIGLYGESSYGTGVSASSGAGTGVYGSGVYGVYGVSSTGVGVSGIAVTSAAKPMVAKGADGQIANLQEWQNSVGTVLSVVDKDGKLGVGTSTPAASIHGETGQSYPAIKGRNTGIGDGIRGESSSGYGLIGTTAASSKAGMYGYGSGSAIGVRAKSVSGFALFVDGKNYFKSAQRGTIPSGVSSCIVTVPSGVTIRSAAMIFVTLMSPPNVSVKWVQRLSDTQFKIWLTGATSSTVAFGYFIVN